MLPGAAGSRKPDQWLVSRCPHESTL